MLVAAFDVTKVVMVHELMFPSRVLPFRLRQLPPLLPLHPDIRTLSVLLLVVVVVPVALFAVQRLAMDTKVPVVVPDRVLDQDPATEDVTGDNQSVIHDWAGRDDTSHHHNLLAVTAIDQHSCVSRRSVDPRRNSLDYQNISICGHSGMVMALENIFCLLSFNFCKNIISSLLCSSFRSFSCISLSKRANKLTYNQD